MNFTKTKTFKINNSELVKIAECCETNYGYYIWPSSIILANFLLENRSTLFNSSSSNLLELGAGTSLSSIIARKYCSLNKVIITDDLIANRDLTNLITESLKLNSISQSDVSIKHLKWADFNKANYSNLPKIDFLIGSDVFFDPKYLIVTVRLLMDFNNPNLLFFTTYEMRSFNGYLKLLYLFEKYNLKFKQIERMPKEHLVEVQEGNNKTNHDSDQHEIILFQINK